MLKANGLSEKSISKQFGMSDDEVVRFCVSSSNSLLNQKIV